MVLIWLLNVYDAVITVYSTSRLGMVETNPIMMASLEFGPVFFVITKVVVLTLALAALASRYRRHPMTVRVILIVSLGAFLGVCAWNSYAAIWVASRL